MTNHQMLIYGGGIKPHEWLEKYDRLHKYKNDYWKKPFSWIKYKQRLIKMR